MEARMFYNTFRVLLVLATLSLYRAVGEQNKEWIEPNAWGEVIGWTDLVNSCPVCESNNAKMEDGVALIYYKKLITNLFGRKKLQFDENAAKYERSFRFTLLPAQLEELEQLSDPRDLDVVLSKIFAEARTMDSCENNVGIIAIISKMVKDSLEMIEISEIQFILIAVSAVMMGIFLHEYFGIGYIRLFFTSLFLFGYFFTYLECNRKLRIDEVIEYIAEADNENSTPMWYSPSKWLSSYGSEQQETIKHLEKQKNLKMRVCRPDHVLISYISDLFMKQFELVIEKLTASSSSLSSSLPFPMNFLGPVLLLYFLGFVVELSYKYIFSPRAWAFLLHSNPQQQQHSFQNQQQVPYKYANAINEDRLSGDNLKLLLNAIKPPKLLVATSSSSSIPAVSGVETVMDQIETNLIATTEGDTKTSDTNDNYNVICNDTLKVLTLSDSLDSSET